MWEGSVAIDEIATGLTELRKKESRISKGRVGARSGGRPLCAGSWRLCGAKAALGRKWGERISLRAAATDRRLQREPLTRRSSNWCESYFCFLIGPTLTFSTTVVSGCVSAYLFVVKRPVLALRATFTVLDMSLFPAPFRLL